MGNNPPTGGSIGSENCVHASMMVCDVLNKRLEPYRKNGQSWTDLIQSATAAGVDLHYAETSTIASNGSPDQYQTYGVVALEVYLDLLSGEYQLLQSDLLMDLGISMNPLLDIGQIEGAYLMGLGLNGCEEVVYNSDGTLFTKSTWEYKIPGTFDIPIVSPCTLPC